MRRWRSYSWVWVAAASAAVVAFDIQETHSLLQPPTSSTRVEASVVISGQSGYGALFRDTHELNTSTLPSGFTDKDQQVKRDGCSLVTWADGLGNRSGTAQQSDHTPPHQPCDDCFLVVGVKTRVVDGFQSRQLIRATWANPQYTQQLNTRVVFLACELDPQRYEDINATRNALALEKQVYGDLLTHELGGCVDSYFRLVDKVVGFYHWVSLSHPATSYVMTGDDDVYVRLDRVVDMLRDEATPRVRYYAGQVTSVQSGRFLTTKRDPKHKNYVSEDDYPLSVHCPRAIGAHYLLSMDLVQFISENRHDLRGLGAIEDLTIGFWLLALLQVHPVHLPEFDIIELGLCRNSLISYGDLSHHAIRQIHVNIKRGESICRGFSWGAWASLSKVLPVYTSLTPRDDVEYEWKISVNASNRQLHIGAIVELSNIRLTLPEVSFIPGLEASEDICEKLYRHATSFKRQLPIMLCDDLLNRLDEFLQQQQHTNSAMFALTRSNLFPLSGTLFTLKVWISRRVLRWRALIECLVAHVYPDIHIYVLDQTKSPTPRALFEPDFVVVADEELLNALEVPLGCRFLVFASTSDIHGLDQATFSRDRVVIMSRDRSPLRFVPEIPPAPTLYVPLASLVFSDSSVQSPLALLLPSTTRRPDFASSQLAIVPHCNPRATLLLLELQELVSDLECLSEHDSTDNEEAIDGESNPETVFAFDAEVTQYAQAKFVLAFQTHQDKPGYIGGSVVAAFVAGSVPVYDGDDATVSQLFNPKAFINCSRFASLRDCAEFIKQVDRSHVLYEAMRSEPPVVNETAFYEVFSWHPDVLQWLRREARSDFQNVDMIERLREMINSI